MVKIDLITGFLGSGKTTFIREYAKYLLEKGEKICIIENDYGAVNIDMVLLQDLYGDNCNLEMIVGGDGQEAHRRRFRTKLISMGMSGYDRVIIEPSGIYDVDEFFDVLYDEPLDRWYEIGNVISIVDAENVESLEGMSRYLFMSEIACAGKIVISKLTDNSDIDSIKKSVNKIMAEFGLGTSTKENENGIIHGNDCLNVKKSENGIICGDYGSDGGGSLENNVNNWFNESKSFVAKPFTELSTEDFTAISSCGYRHASYVKLPLEDKQFTPLFYFDVEISKEKLEEIVKGLFNDEKAGRIIRIKGFVKTGDNTQIELNATENEIKTAPVISSRNVLIIIGENLNKDYINVIWKDYCSVTSL